MLDIGCGYGNDTLYLRERGVRVISCDFSGEALARLHHFIDSPETKQFDMREGLPFEDASAMIVIADLSLHYFPWAETKRIVSEIRRVLLPGGYLFFRVNSVNDRECPSGRGIRIEPHYYNMGGRKKRYFNGYHIQDLLRGWVMIHCDEYCLPRFGKQKILWEAAARKIC